MFSKSAADRILRRAAEIERRDDGKPLSLDELRSIAAEAGFGHHAVERAIAEEQRLAVRGRPPQPVQKSGWIVTRLSASRTVPVDLTSEQLMTAIRLFQPYRDGPVHVRLEHDCLTWRDRRGLTFTLWSAGGLTEIQVFTSKIMIRRGRRIAWVKAAADRLEALLVMVSAGSSASPALEQRRQEMAALLSEGT